MPDILESGQWQMLSLVDDGTLRRLVACSPCWRARRSSRSASERPCCFRTLASSARRTQAAMPSLSRTEAGSTQ